MKTLITILISIILVLIGFTGYYMKKSELKPIDLSAKNMRDSLENVYTTKELKFQDSIEIKYSQKRVEDKTKIIKAEYSANAEKERADSAETRYNRAKTIEGCDSVIFHKNAEIKAKDEVISGYITKSLDDSIVIDVLHKKIETLSISRNYYKEGNDRLKVLIEKNNSLINWTNKHKFWTWLLRIR